MSNQQIVPKLRNKQRAKKSSQPTPTNVATINVPIGTPCIGVQAAQVLPNMTAHFSSNFNNCRAHAPPYMVFVRGRASSNQMCNSRWRQTQNAFEQKTHLIDGLRSSQKVIFEPNRNIRTKTCISETRDAVSKQHENTEPKDGPSQA